MPGLIPQSFIDNLLTRTDIVEVIGARLNLQKAGGSHKARCPFHNEKTPSFIINASKQFYHCFGCGANGSAISFLMEHDHLSFPEAVEELAAMAGLEVPHESGGAGTRQHTNLYAVLETCGDFFQRQLRSHRPAINYLQQRGLSGQIARLFAIGYAPQRHALPTDLIDCQQSDLLSAGMLVKHSDSGEIYDRFRNRITFPIRDHRGRTIGFGGRVLNGGQPKYLNSPETPVFHKGDELYGLYEVLRHNRKLQSLLVVEGYMDVIGLWQHGVCNAVATLGTATTTRHLERLFRVVNEVIFCFDGDRAGRQAAWRALQTTLPTLQDGREVRFLFLAEGEDPDSLVQSRGREGFLSALHKALPLADYLFQGLLGENAHDDSIGTRTQLATAAKPLLKTIPGDVYRTLLYQKLSEHVGANIDDERSDTRSAGPPAAPRRRQSAHQVQLKPMRMAVMLALQRPAAVSADDIEQYNFDDQEAGGYILQKLISLILANPTLSTAALLEHFRDTRHAKFLGILAGSEIPGIDDADDEQRPRTLLLECIRQLDRARHRRRQSELRGQIAQGEMDDDLKARLRTQVPYKE